MYVCVCVYECIRVDCCIGGSLHVGCMANPFPKDGGYDEKVCVCVCVCVCMCMNVYA